jgi:hypothetical protein
VAADRPACARLVAVAPAGRSAASYTITRDTTRYYASSTQRSGLDLTCRTYSLRPIGKLVAWPTAGSGAGIQMLRDTIPGAR